MIPVSGLRTTRVSSNTCRRNSSSCHAASIRRSVRVLEERIVLTGSRGDATLPTVETRQTVTDEWIHICERCGERMEERKCKIVCTNCGFIRDCSDP